MKKIYYLLIVFLLCGCGVLHFPRLNAPPPPETTYTYEEEFRKSCQPGVDIERSVRAGYTVKEKKLTFLQRFGDWISNLGMLAFVGITIGLVFFPLATMTWLWNRYLQFKKALTQTVKGIESVRATEKDLELKTSLSSTQDNDTKRLVDDLRRK